MLHLKQARLLAVFAGAITCLSLLSIGIGCDKEGRFSSDGSSSSELLCGFRSGSSVEKVVQELRDRMHVSDPTIQKERLRLKRSDSRKIELVHVIIDGFHLMGTKGKLVLRFYDDKLTGVNYNTCEMLKARRQITICYIFGGSLCPGVMGIPRMRGSIKLDMHEFHDDCIAIDSEDILLGKKYGNRSGGSSS